MTAQDAERIIWALERIADVLERERADRLAHEKAEHDWSVEYLAEIERKRGRQ